MAIQKYSGFIATIDAHQATIGNRTTKWYKYSILEVGDKVLQQVTVPERLVVFLKAGNNVGIYLNGKAVVAVEREDGKLFVVNHKKPGIASLIIGIALIPFYGLGLLVLFGRYKAGKGYDEVQQIISQHASYENIVG